MAFCRMPGNHACLRLSLRRPPRYLRPSAEVKNLLPSKKRFGRLNTEMNVAPLGACATWTLPPGLHTKSPAPTLPSESSSDPSSMKVCSSAVCSCNGTTAPGAILNRMVERPSSSWYRIFISIPSNAVRCQGIDDAATKVDRSSGGLTGKGWFMASSPQIVFDPVTSAWGGSTQRNPPLRSIDLVDRHLVRDAAQLDASERWRQPVGLKQGAGRRFRHHLFGRHDRARGRKALDARRDIDGLAKIVLLAVERDREAGSFVDAHLQAQALMLTLGAEIAHRLAHADRSGNGAVRRLEGRHHGIADGLHDGPSFGGDNLLQQPEMLVDEIEGDEVADALIERGRVLEIAEQESQAQDLEALADGERFGPVDVAEGLIGEETLCGENGLASLQEVVQRLVRHPYSRQHATLGAVFQSQAQWPGAQGNGVDRNLYLAEDHRQVLALARLLAADIEELGRMRHGIEHDQRAFRQLQRKDGPFPRRQVDAFEHDLPQQLLQIGWKIDGRTPEDLAIIFGRGQFVGAMGRDLPHARAYREGHLDQVVECRLIARGAESATILRPIQGLQAFIGGKNTGATWAHDVPCHLENAEPHRIQERRDDSLLVEAF